MPPNDDRDRTRQTNTDNPAVRDPYGHGNLNAGGTILGQWAQNGANAYGLGSVDYSGQAAKAYDLAQRTMKAIGVAKNTFALDDPTTGRRDIIMRPDNNFSSRADMTDPRNRTQLAAARARTVGQILRRAS